MKTLISILTIISFQLSAQNICHEWSKIAEMSAKSRQEHKPLDKLLESIEKSSFNDADKNTFVAIMKDAHSYPIYPLIDDKLKFIKDFGDTIFLQCLNEIAGGA